MKKRTKHFASASIAVALAAVTAFGGIGPAVVQAAETKETINYVSLGDSMTNGYGLTNYDNNGFKTYGDEAYPNQFAEWLVEEGYATNVNHSEYALSATRAEDLHFILEFPVDNQNAINVADKYWDENKYDEAYEWWNSEYADVWNATFSTGDFYTWDEFTNNGRYAQNCGGTNAAAKAYQEAVKEADIVSLGVGNANFGVFLMGRMTNAIGFKGSSVEDSWIDIERALNECDADTKAQVLELKAELETLLKEELATLALDAQTATLIDPLVNAISYTAISYVLNYAGSVEAILQLNPDAEIILVGIMNTMAGMDFTITVEGTTKTIAMEELMKVLVEPVNAYIAALPTAMQAAGNSVYADATFYYAEAPVVECMVDTYEEALADADSVVRNRFVKEIVNDGKGLVWSMIAPMFAELGVNLENITLDDIVAYENAVANNNFDSISNEEYISCAIYLAFEQAIVAGSKNSTISADSLVSLATGFDGVFDGVSSALMTGLDMEAIKNSVMVDGATEVQEWANSNQETVAAMAQTLDITDMNQAAMCAFALEKNLTTAEELAGILSTEGMDGVVEKITSVMTAYFMSKYVAKNLVAVSGPQITPVLANALTSDDTLMGLLHLFGRMLIGDGLGAHPSVAGHNDLAEAVITAYADEYTAEDATIDKAKEALDIAAELVAEYYDEAYAYAYDYAEENGYIADANEALDAAIVALNGIDVDSLDLSAEMKAELENAIENAIETINEAKELIAEADLLDQATLDALNELLGKLGQNMTDIREILTQAGIEAGEAAWVAYEEAVRILEDEIIPDVMNKLEAAVKAGTDWLIEEAGEAYDALVEEITNAAKEYGPEVADYIYNWLYNNPDKVIAFFNEYGDEMVAFVDEYSEEMIAVLGFLVAEFGDEVANYVLENADEILTALVEFYEVHGENTWALIMVYAEELGLIDALDGLVDEQAVIDAVNKLYACITGKLDELKDAIDGTIDGIEDAIGSDIEDAKEVISGMIDNAIAKADGDLNAFLAALEEEINGAIDDVKDACADAYDDATHGEYVATYGSHYVAIGDSVVVGDNTYEERFAAVLAEEYGVKTSTSFELDGFRTEDIRALLDDSYEADAYGQTLDASVAEGIVEEIEKADIITVSLGNDNFTSFVTAQMQALLAGNTYELDWERYVTAEGIPYVEAMLEDVHEKFVEEGLDTDISLSALGYKTVNVAELLTDMVEVYAYGFAGFSTNYTEALNAIHEINPDAQVVVVGMFNPIDEMVVEDVALGEYVDYFIELSNQMFAIYAMITPNTTFVETPDATTNADGNTDVLNYALALSGIATNVNYADYLPNAEGQEYIKEQILGAMDITTNYLKGDINMDGFVDQTDLGMLYNYVGEYIELTPIQLKIANVTGDTYVDQSDLGKLYNYVGEYIESL